ncbi:zinc finger protein 593-like [Macrobrachium nipponense]|uniref:zinc finger protein 593-like n=1 Tax=Macrobrachium nipponense TaxID=159736 RepID=UPI0030C89222
MGQPQRKKRRGRCAYMQRRIRLRNRKRDLDQIDGDLKEENASKLLHQEFDFDKPGGGQHYCLHCARYFITVEALHGHFRTKVHKRRLKALELEPHTIEESERAGGLGNYIPPKKRKMQTQPVDNGTYNVKEEDADMKVDKDADMKVEKEDSKEMEIT